MHIPFDPEKSPEDTHTHTYLQVYMLYKYQHKRVYTGMEGCGIFRNCKLLLIVVSEELGKEIMQTRETTAYHLELKPKSSPGL